MCINTHCTPFKITKYYTTIKVKARVQPLKKLKSPNNKPAQMGAGLLCFSYSNTEATVLRYSITERC